MGRAKKKPLSEEERKAKKTVIKLIALYAVNIIAILLLIAVIILAFIDKRTPSLVYIIVGLFVFGLETLISNFSVRYAKKVRLSMGYAESEAESRRLTERKAADYKIKDKTYYILTGFGFFGDLLLIVGVIFLAGQVNVPEAVTVIAILLGALIALIFHITATVRFFRRKSKAENGVFSTKDIK